MAGPSARLRRIISSPEFKEALVGSNPTKKEAEFADKAADALLWSVEAVEDTYGYYSTSQAVEGVRQSHQLGVLLKTHGPKGTFYDAIREASKKIEKDIPKKEKDENAPARTMYEDLHDDLYYIDHTLKVGMDLPKLDPESVKNPTGLASSWKSNMNDLLENAPHDPEGKKDCLAKVLVSAFEAGIAPERKKPFSQKNVEKYAKQLQSQPIYKKICENPNKVKELLKADPKDPNKHYNSLMNMYRPFGNVPKGKSNAVLMKIKGMLPYMDGKEGRSSKWKDLIESIETIDINDPENSGEKKLQEVFDKTCAYSKGKKSLRKKASDQNRVDQSMDVLAELAGCTEYAAAAAELVIDRTNEVRQGHDSRYKSISLKNFGASKIFKHSNVKQQVSALDMLPEDPALLPTIPSGKRNQVSPVSEYTKELAPLASDRKMNVYEAANVIALAVVLSETKVYHFPGNPDLILDKNEKKKIKGEGRAVIVSGKLLEKVMTMSRSPAVMKLAEKYKDPEARKELFRDGRPDLALKDPLAGISVVKADPNQKPDKVIKWNSEVVFDVSKLNVQKLQEEYAAAQNEKQPVVQ